MNVFTSSSFVIPQLVQVTEYTDLGKLGDSRQKHETQVAVGTLQHAIKGLQRPAIFIHQHLIREGLKQRFVVFINQNNRLLTGTLISTFYHVGKTFFRTSILAFGSILLLPLFQILVEHGKQIGNRST